MFWDKYTELCNRQGIKPRALASELGVAPATVTRWKNGSIPNKDTLERIAGRLGVSADYLISESSTDSTLDEKKNPILKLKSAYQRKISLRSCGKLSKLEVVEISEYVNASLYFLNSDKCVEYVPENPDRTMPADSDTEILFRILNLMDGCADTDSSATLQIQLSRIVLYHLAKKGFTEQELYSIKELLTEKLKFLYTGKANIDPTVNFGLNFSDLVTLYEVTGLSYRYMFTGLE